MVHTEKRNDERLPVLWHGTITTEDELSFPCQIMDVSHAGTLISVDANLALGAELVLTVEGIGEFACEIRWVGNSELGLTLIAGPDLLLKKFAEKAGASLSKSPEVPDQS